MENTYTMEDLYSKGTPVTGIQSAVNDSNKQKAKAGFMQGMETGKKSLAEELVARENAARAEAVAQRQQEALLMDIQRRMQSGEAVDPREAGLYNSMTQVGMPR